MWFKRKPKAPPATLAHQSAPQPAPSSETAEDWQLQRARIDAYLGVGAPDATPSREGVELLVKALCDPISPQGIFAKKGLTMVFPEGSSPDDIFGPFFGWEDATQYRVEWCERASEAWLEPLFEVFREPPDLARYGVRFLRDWTDPEVQGDWHHQFSSVLTGWINQHPTLLNPFLDLAGDKNLRPNVLAVVGVVKGPVDLAHLESFCVDLSGLGDGDLECLVRAIRKLEGPESNRLLLRLRDSIPAHMEESARALKKCLSERGLG